jgi:hypothetical protein
LFGGVTISKAAFLNQPKALSLINKNEVWIIWTVFDLFTLLLLTGAMNARSVLSLSNGSNAVKNETINGCNSMFTFSKLMPIFLLVSDVLVINYSGKGVCIILLINILN